MPALASVVRYQLILPAIFLVTSGARLYGFFHERSDIWWTPQGTVVPLAESHPRVAIYVRGRELDDLVAAGHLRVLVDSVTRVVRTADIGLRYNNWDRVRAERISSLLISGVTAGAAAALLLVGLIIARVRGRSGGTSPRGQP